MELDRVFDCAPDEENYFTQLMFTLNNDLRSKNHFSKKCEGATSLHIACMNPTERQFSSIDLLLKNGANPNASDITGWTPLHYASKYSSPAIVEALLRSGANPNVKDIDNLTPLHIVSAESKSPKKVEILLLSGTNPNAKDKHGFTPLHLVSTSDTTISLEIVDILLRNGAEPNIRDKYGFTPLHHASMFLTGSNISRVVVLLIRGGAMPINEVTKKLRLEIIDNERFKSAKIYNFHKLPSRFEDRDYIFNNTTRRWVKKCGATGKKLIEEDRMDIVVTNIFK